MKSLFLSHSHADKKFARKLAKDLRDHLVFIWIDEAEIKVGDSLLQKISDGIDKVDYVGVVLSTASVRSRWVQKEVEIAMNQEIAGRRIRVLPILREDCDLPLFLVGKLYADFRGSYSQGLKALLSALDTSPFGGPHQPIIRSHEISVSAKSADQVPQVVQKGNHLLIQWVEHGEDMDLVYIYRLDALRFQFLDYFFYPISSEIFDHWLVVSGDTASSFVHLTGTRELWFTRLTNPRKLNPIKLDWSDRFIRSITGTPQNFLATSSSKEQIELVEISAGGLIRRRAARRVSNWPTHTSLVKSPKGMGIFFNSLRGIELSLIDKSFSILQPKIIVPSKRHNTIPAKSDVRFYDNCTWADNGEFFLLYHQTVEGGEDINVCVASPKGRVIKSTTVITNTNKGVVIFKPSFGIGRDSVLVLWNVKERVPSGNHKVHEKTLLSCMLFDKETFKPLLPYERTLTAGSNYSSGVPVIASKDNYYIVYQEDALEQFKIKVSEISLSELPK